MTEDSIPLCIVRAVSTGYFNRYVVAAVGAALLTASCSSPTSAKTTSAKTGTNEGLCELVGPSVVATALEVSMHYPSSLIQGSTTQCYYRAKEGSNAVLINFDTRSSTSNFARGRDDFERHGLKLGPVEGLGDQAYYFNEQASQGTVTTIVVLKNSLQILVSGSGQIDQIGAIARYALEEFEATHPPGAPASG